MKQSLIISSPIILEREFAWNSYSRSVTILSVKISEDFFISEINMCWCSFGILQTWCLDYELLSHQKVREEKLREFNGIQAKTTYINGIPCQWFTIPLGAFFKSKIFIHLMKLKETKKSKLLMEYRFYEK